MLFTLIFVVQYIYAPGVINVQNKKDSFTQIDLGSASVVFAVVVAVVALVGAVVKKFIRRSGVQVPPRESAYERYGTQPSYAEPHSGDDVWKQSGPVQEAWPPHALPERGSHGEVRGVGVEVNGGQLGQTAPPATPGPYAQAEASQSGYAAERAAAGAPGVRLFFDRSEVFVKYRDRVRGVESMDIPLYAPAKSGVRFSDVLGLGSDAAAKIFGEDHELYWHQHEALRKLDEPNTSVVIVPTSNASGKTEIGMLHTMRIISRGVANVAIVLVFPTKALASDQFRRWCDRLRKFAEVLGYGPATECAVEGRAVPYLDAGGFLLLLLDGDTVKRGVKGVLDRERGGDRPLVVLTNPQFLLNLAQQDWRKYFGNRCLIFSVVDEVHFYRTYDLTLLTILLHYLIQKHGCREGGRLWTKVLMLSATMGDPVEFVNELKDVWQRRGPLRGEFSVIEYKGGNEVVGVKRMFVVRTPDEATAESIMVNYVKEMLNKAERQDAVEKTLIFVGNRNMADRLWKELQRYAVNKFGEDGWRLVDRHTGDMGLWERGKVEGNFRSGKTRILLTVKTLEVGIDIGDVARVIHVGLPPSINDFVQREGRIGRRQGEYESVVLIYTRREEKLLDSYLQGLRRPGQMAPRMYRPRIDLDSRLIEEVARQVIHQGKKVPRYIRINMGPNNILYTSVHFYDRRCPLFNGPRVRRECTSPRFYVFDGRRNVGREVRMYDIIFRYLPGMIRPMTGIYIVRGVNISERRKSISVALLNDRVFADVWRHRLARSLNKVADGVGEGRIFTVSDVDITFEVPSPRPFYADDLETIKVTARALGVKLVEKEYRKVVRTANDGRRVETQAPYFKLLGYRPVEGTLGLWWVLRGVHIKKSIKELEVLYDVLVKELGQHGGALQGVPEKERVESYRFYTEYLLQEHLHSALHLALNTAFELERIRPDEIEHYVAVRFGGEEDVRRFMEGLLLNRPVEGVPVDIEVAVGSDVDVVKDVNWAKVLERLEEIGRSIQPDLDALRDVAAELYLARCFHQPTYVEDLLTRENAERNAERAVGSDVDVVKAAETLRAIVGLSRALTEDIMRQLSHA